MEGQKFKIIFKQNKAYLTSDKPMTFKQLGLPPIAKSFKSPAFWTIEILHYNKEEKKLFVDVLTYHVGKTDFPYNQKQASDELKNIEKITFKSIDTDGLIRTLKGTTPVIIKPAKYESVYRPKTTYQNDTPIKKEPIKKIIDETFFISLKNIRFKQGCVQFNKKFKEYNETLELTISNDELREEFDAVKDYFAKVLKTKKIKVSVYIEILNNKLISKTVKSPEIEKINENFIHEVKLEFVKSTTKKKISDENDKNIYTMDEYLKSFAGKKFKSNTFYSNDKELLEDLLKVTNTKHYKHIRYLSEIHSHKIMKLRFVHNPFSFIFLFEGNKNYHIIWETLDTKEATYIWHVDKNIQVLKQALRRIEEIIRVIKVKGKTSYIHSTNDSFSRIYHDYSVLIDGFEKWKGELKKILI